ncbi:hypothetical protein SAICODRAFT_7924 [Saitoella complicata NRRL Y-17804]|uniref:uncharacterized protein n=1 Tax=Saitoella complicata (strain BCRC 22490 / CBS 7301 / JCM 7358 / NBRC 10748 / NRRL Y-17804) TaxID=698492 RepID=UPI000866B6ED|nr:uncharacterized protein SAICODRAFT_7924 [Saitoella complicata NRRL Y-17804]ODQ52495.1 hypothetical protein SAICODRAFT_7924 [Saitoella complicata NRRL Y-17804]
MSRVLTASPLPQGSLPPPAVLSPVRQRAKPPSTQADLIQFSAVPDSNPLMQHSPVSSSTPARPPPFGGGPRLEREDTHDNPSDDEDLGVSLFTKDWSAIEPAVLGLVPVDTPPSLRQLITLLVGHSASSEKRIKALEDQVQSLRTSSNSSLLRAQLRDLEGFKSPVDVIENSLGKDFRTPMESPILPRLTMVENVCNTIPKSSTYTAMGQKIADLGSAMEKVKESVSPASISKLVEDSAISALLPSGPLSSAVEKLVSDATTGLVSRTDLGALFDERILPLRDSIQAEALQSSTQRGILDNLV